MPKIGLEPRPAACSVPIYFVEHLSTIRTKHLRANKWLKAFSTFCSPELMTDLLEALPDFNLKPYSHLIHSLEKNLFTVSDLITLDPVEIAKACPLPLTDVRNLVRDIIEALRKGAGISIAKHGASSELLENATSQPMDASRHLMTNALKEPGVIKTLDPVIDEALGGGIHTGCITEIAGESAAGKSQLVFGLLLSVQLPSPQGLSRNAIYISTETPLNTSRLKQMRTTHPAYLNSTPDCPTFDNVFSIPVNDLEAQEHIIEYQVPIAVEKYNIGLIVMDSVAANFRAEHETRTPEGLAERAKDLAKLGKMFRKIAIKHNLAVVVTNQVADRFDDPAARIPQGFLRSSPAFPSSQASMGGKQPQTPVALASAARREELMSLDYQQRFFTGWGDEHGNGSNELKTPALGLAWTNQIAARIVLKVEGERAQQRPEDYTGGNIWRPKKRRRFMSVVFAPWVEPTEVPVEYEIKMEGIVAVRERVQEDPPQEPQKKPDQEKDISEEHAELLDEKLWGVDGSEEDEEFP